MATELKLKITNLSQQLHSQGYWDLSYRLDECTTEDEYNQILKEIELND